jgi:hypothetical protein
MLANMTCVTRRARNRHTARHHQHETPAPGSGRQNRYIDLLNTASAERRHTYAVHLLTELVRQQLATIGEQKADMRHNAYRRVMGDPLVHLQKLLGHARIATTYIYLDSIGEAQQLIDEAVGDLAERLQGSDAEEILAELTTAGA